MRVALIQMHVSYGKPEENLKRARGFVAEAASQSADVVVLPEMWNTGYDLENIRETADVAGSPCAETIGKLAAEHKVNIVAGSVADKREDQVYNTTYVFNRQGTQVARYSKVHLFGLMDEDRHLSRGKEVALFELDGVKCGSIICYDLRFPELSRSIALGGAKILFVPAQWPNPRKHPWRILNQARAIENQLFVVGVNRVGEGGGLTFFGHSVVVDPLGDVKVEGDEREQVLIFNLDLAEIDTVRARMNCFADRVEEAYFRK